MRLCTYYATAPKFKAPGGRDSMKQALYAFFLLTTVASVAVGQTLDGTVFRDYNDNGSRQALEPGVPGISVDVFDATGSSVGTTTTAADGTYSAALSVGAGTEVRIEFSGIPSYLEPGSFGSESGTTVMFVQSGDSGVDLGLANPGKFCPGTVDLATSCFLTGPQDTNDGVVVTIPEIAGSDDNGDPTLYDLPAYNVEAEADELGAVWGLDYNSRDDLIYAGTFVKRLSDVGPTGNPTTIYEIDRGAGTVSTWLTLDGARANPHSGDIDGWDRDFDAFDDVFKEGLGDLDIAEDESTVYTVDLATREFVAIAVNADGSAGTVTQVPIVSAVFPALSGAGCPSTDDVRPFGLGVNDGTVYLGVVCSAESTVDAGTELPVEGPIFDLSAPRPASFPPGDETLLRGHVFTWDGALGFTEVLSFPLTYRRGCLFLNDEVDCEDPHGGAWKPWVDVYPYYNRMGSTPSRHSAGYPQPLISDIEFDNGEMILGIADRWGHQTGPRSTSPAYPQNPGGGVGELRSPFSAGDILRACSDGSGGFLIEQLIDPANTSCDTVGTSSNVDSTVSIDEYYHADSYSNITDQHGEITLGGISQIPGRPDVVATSYDPVYPFNGQLDDGGLSWFTNANGDWSKAYRLYDGDLTSPGLLLLKAAGLGDVAPLCPRGPLEVGNRVWNDPDANGLQDPGEAGINGVTVQLRCGGMLLATTMTSDLGGTADDGSYLFNDSNVTGGIPEDSACEVRIDPADPALGALFPTLPNSGSNDLNDSDGVLLGGFLTASFTTGGPLANNHTYDFGFTLVAPATITVLKTASPTSLPEPGGLVTYTVDITNDSAILGVTIDTLTDSVLGNLDGVGTCSVPQAIAASGTYQCQFTRMVSGVPGDTPSCTVTGSGEDDLMNPVSDDDPETVTITDVPSSIVVTKTAVPAVVSEPGGTVTLNITITNTSAVDTVTIDSLTDDVTGNLDGEGTCSVPQVLAPSAVYSCSYSMDVVGVAGDMITCTTTGSGDDDDGNPVSDDDPTDIEVVTTLPPVNIPTLSTVALMLFAGFLSLLGAAMLRRRQRGQGQR